MSFTNWFAQFILQLAVKGIPWTATTYNVVALWIGDPGPDGAEGNEVSGGGYAAQAMQHADWSTITANSVSNVTPIIFPTAVSPWGTVTHVVVYGVVGIAWGLFYGELVESKEIATGSETRFATGELSITLY